MSKVKLNLNNNHSQINLYNYDNANYIMFEFQKKIERICVNLLKEEYFEYGNFGGRFQNPNYYDCISSYYKTK